MTLEQAFEQGKIHTHPLATTGTFRTFTIDGIAAIRLECYLAGLRKGAKLCDITAVEQRCVNFDGSIYGHAMLCQKAILDHADQLTEVPND